MHLAHHLTALGRLRAEPAAHIAVLRAAEPEPDGDPAALLTAEEEVRGDHEALLVLLSRQWGEPHVLDLGPHLLAAADGAGLPEPEGSLCWRVARLAFWTVEGRWIGLGLARRSEAVPLQLLAAVGERGRQAPAPSVPG
ncbi:hypothetical protein [Streptomyces reniochalinae]|uniref:Uncharacterized protein n=1 Tax=Streptomyces reniochalinae TaxID=2250578 RepID=A0A367E725_9ACTN|nr:hypothetical protein [Streptomyces reniochalinae]RCG13858.1 hypothetical protein DQ392_30545 [Streptomyces reniochalinae]